MADQTTLARPYAQALFELASADGALADWSAALDAAGTLVALPEVAELVGDPSISEARLLEMLQSLLGELPPATPLTGDGHGRNFLKLLIANDRVGLLPEIAERFQALKLQAENTVDVTITTAAAMDDSQENQITQALRARLGRDINVTTAINEDLIGGAVIRAGDFVIDGSVRTKLTKMSALLSK